MSTLVAYKVYIYLTGTEIMYHQLLCLLLLTKKIQVP